MINNSPLRESCRHCKSVSEDCSAEVLINYRSRLKNLENDAELANSIERKTADKHPPCFMPPQLIHPTLKHENKSKTNSRDPICP
jgi:hypothetical protein